MNNMPEMESLFLAISACLNDLNFEKDDVFIMFRTKEDPFSYLDIDNHQKVINQLALIYELICALEKSKNLDKNITIWKFLPISIKDKICFPTEDVGIDLIDEELSYCGQVKHYQIDSTIKSEHVNRSMLCFYHLKDNSEIFPSKLEFITPPGVKLPNGCKLKFPKYLQHDIINHTLVEKWIRKALKYKPQKTEKKKFELRKCQIEALKIMENKWGDSIRIEMICGAGKTDLACYQISLKMNERFLILVPRVILLEQWSDKLTEWGIDHSCRGTGYLDEDNSRVIVCVYNSFYKVCDEEWNYMIIDEAHHIENCEDIDEDTDLEDNKYKVNYLDLIVRKSKKIPTIYFSATLEGDVDYRYSLEEGIDDKVICDYQIHVPIYNSLFYQKPLIQYLIDHPEFLSILAYCNRIDKAQKFCDELIENGFTAKCLTCKESKNERKKILNGFRNGEFRALVSVSILGEGVDIKNANTCVFVDSKSSYYSIIQSTMRVMRANPGKDMSYIVLPCIEDSEDKEISRFIKVLSEKDERLNKVIKREDISHRIRVEKVGGENSGIDEDSQFLYDLILTSTDKLSDVWNFKYGILEDFIEKHNRMPLKREKYEEINIGSWFCCQKVAFNHNLLSTERIQKLDKLKISWKPIEKEMRTWEEILEACKNFFIENEKMPGTDNLFKGISLGNWIKRERQLLKNKEQISNHTMKLDESEIPWRPKNEKRRIRREWSENCESFSNFFKENKIMPPKGTKDGEIRLDAWIYNQRIKFRDEELSENKIEMLDEVTPIWRENIRRKNLTFEESAKMLQKFVTENQRMIKQVELVNGIAIGDWLSNQRYKFKKHELTDKQIKILDDIDVTWRENITE